MVSYHITQTIIQYLKNKFVAILKLKQEELLERDLEGILKIIGNNC